jgi:hypothetical protein
MTITSYGAAIDPPLPVDRVRARARHAADRPITRGLETNPGKHLT